MFSLTIRNSDVSLLVSIGLGLSFNFGGIVLFNISSSIFLGSVCFILENGSILSSAIVVWLVKLESEGLLSNASRLGILSIVVHSDTNLDAILLENIFITVELGDLHDGHARLNQVILVPRLLDLVNFITLISSEGAILINFSGKNISDTVSGDILSIERASTRVVDNLQLVCASNSVASNTNVRVIIGNINTIDVELNPLGQNLAISEKLSWKVGVEQNLELFIVDDVGAHDELSEDIELTIAVNIDTIEFIKIILSVLKDLSPFFPFFGGLIVIEDLIEEVLSLIGDVRGEFSGRL